jgi:hypothetical protein
VKTCKGVTRAVANAALAARMTEAGGRAFVSAEDLCVQPGIALQQNLALAAALGLSEAERNGHHYGPGPLALPREEHRALQREHPDLYGERFLLIREGALSAASSVRARGFGTTVLPALHSVTEAV